ncbi:hypothetical protein [Halomonas heilongjiangensis]|nr:hypothetical protein [Halomonas heilongjiangensis]
MLNSPTKLGTVAHHFTEADGVPDQQPLNMSADGHRLLLYVETS